MNDRDVKEQVKVLKEMTNNTGLQQVRSGSMELQQPEEPLDLPNFDKDNTDYSGQGEAAQVEDEDNDNGVLDVPKMFE